MARIALISVDDMTPEQRAVHDRISSGPRGGMRGPFQASIHRAELTEAWQAFGEMLRYGTVFPPRLSELAIIMTARRWNSGVEWHIHSAIALKEGLPEDCVAAIRDVRAPAFPTEEEEVVYDFARQVLNFGTTTDEVHKRLRERWGDLGAVELTALLGYYSLVAMTLNAHDLPAPEGAVPDLPVRTDAAAGDPPHLTEIPPLQSRVGRGAALSAEGAS